MKGLPIIRAAFQILLAAVLAIPALAMAATVEYIHTDALGSPVAVTNSAGQVIERREYEPYGRQLAPAALANGPGYTGHVTDAVTGLAYMQQRYYDPAIGAFLSVDPVTAYDKPVTNFNRYAYARNNPYRFTDPDGREGATFYADPQLKMQIEWTPEQVDAAIAVASVAYGGGAAAAGFKGLAAGLRALANVLRGSARDSRPEGVPKNWEKTDSKKGGGQVFRNPENKHDQVRSMPGNPKSSNPAQQKPYVTRQMDGKNYDAAGKAVSGKSPEAHIPKDEFKFIPREELKKLNP